MITAWLRRLALLLPVLAGCSQDYWPSEAPVTCYQFDTRAKMDSAVPLDLLVVLDNSPQMADKQQFVRQGVADFVHRLISPPCLRADGTTDSIPADPFTACPEGTWRENAHFFDLHVGVVTSSLADPFGGCPAVASREDGRLVAPNRAATYGGIGFLSWDLFQEQSPPGERDVAKLEAALTEILDFAARPGCQFPAPLEAAYRFLVDPEPYVSLTVDSAGQARPVGVDQMLLFERAQFLRPDSHVLVAIFSESNDCSVALGERVLARDAGGSPYHPPRGTSACLTKPDDACCFACGGAPPTGCLPSDLDPECQKGPLTDAEDLYALRCFHQKERFGRDSLYPVKRYVDGFSGAKVPDRDGQLVANPLFADLSGTGHFARDPYVVTVLGVVGVPWQYVAKDSTNIALGFQQHLFVFDEARVTGDPLMIESIEPRTGNGIAPPNSAPSANPINGHEHLDMADLQYACAFWLPAGVACDAGAACPCADSASTMNPICQGLDGQYGDVQLRGEARPGVRHVEMLLGLEDQGSIASICPAKLTGATTAPDYGYRPALSADVMDTFYAKYRYPYCLPRKLPVETCTDAADPRNGQVSCTLIEAVRRPGKGCDCDSPGRRVPDPSVVREEMRGGWDDMCLCEITQLSGSDGQVCRNDTSDIIAPAGWCYVEPARGLGNPNLVRMCGDTEKQVMRIVGGPRPTAPASTVWIHCGYCVDRDAPPDAAADGCQLRTAY